MWVAPSHIALKTGFVEPRAANDESACELTCAALLALASTRGLIESLRSPVQSYRKAGIFVSSIGLILRADDPLQKLPMGWQPEALASRQKVEQVLWTILGCRVVSNKLDFEDSLELKLDEEPIRCISVSGVFGPREMELIQRICTALSARFYDAEVGDFTL